MTEKKVLAKIEGRELTSEEVQQFIDMMGPQGMQFQNDEGTIKIADELVNQELIYLDAQKSGLDKDPAYLKELEKSKENLLKQFAINKLLSSVEVTDEDIKEYYESHKDHFKKPMLFKASHILVEDEDKAKEVREKVLSNEMTFEEAAKEYSSCPSAAEGGKLGEFQEGQMVKEFEEAAKTAEVGTLTEPVKTQFGYHLIQVDERKVNENADFDEVKDELKRQIAGIKQQEAYLNKIDSIKGDYKVEKFY